MFVGQAHLERFGFSEKPMHLFVNQPSFVSKGVGAPVLEGVHEIKVNDACLFFHLSPDRSTMVTSVPVFDVSLWKVPVPLRVLQQQHRPEVDQHHSAGGLHAVGFEAPLMAFPTSSAP